MKKLLLVAGLLFVSQQIGCAVLSDAEMTSPEYIINSGYSTEMAEMVNYQKSKSLAEEFTSIKPVKRCKRTKFGRFWRRCLEYIDPMLEDDSFYVHDIEMEPRTTDF